MLLGLATIPAIVYVGVAYVTRDTPVTDFEFITYREYVGVSNILLVFVALTAPDIMCPDRRQHVLPLLFARPLTGVDYVFAKVGAMFAILFAFGFLPQVVLFVGQMLVSDDGALKLRPRQRRGALAGAHRRRAPLAVLRVDRRGDRVADDPPDHRRCVDHRAVPRHVHRRPTRWSGEQTASESDGRPVRRPAEPPW